MTFDTMIILGECYTITNQVAQQVHCGKAPDQSKSKFIFLEDKMMEELFENYEFEAYELEGDDWEDARRDWGDYDDWAQDECPLDGDAESALASAGWGTDEDYGYFGGDEM